MGKAEGADAFSKEGSALRVLTVVTVSENESSTY